jgi:small subunit ribosomal protein S17
MINKQTTIVRKKIGQVVAANSKMTATVLVERIKEHRLYKKKFRVGKKFLCENPENKYQIGDLVEIVPTKPLSKRKHYLISRRKND